MKPFLNPWKSRGYIFQSVHWDSCVFYTICLLHFSMCYCWPACISGHHVQTSACRIQKRSSDLLDLGYRQLSCTILLLRVKPRSFERAAIVLNYWTVSVAPPYAFQEKINSDAYKTLKLIFKSIYFPDYA